MIIQCSNLIFRINKIFFKIRDCNYHERERFSLVGG